ncbi:hypothetical protein HPB48_004186 [Haemaphysalis longicornis]|uniref:RING-CH-type domain-containing protein n=1 Tax=Haemaphysalis longicornis TaxID=44386 RepID=A0A9J6GQY3_HAELO|nr:hypothetical protein HPB48_004186 [Haemaphysalis longicornis]
MDAKVGAEPDNQAVSGSEKTAATTIQPMAAAAKAGAQPGYSESSLGADSTTPVCRICYKRANVDCGPLVAPCSCKGSIGFAHKSCIERWLRDRTTDQCTVCLASLNVRRTPAVSLPDIIIASLSRSESSQAKGGI